MNVPIPASFDLFSFFSNTIFTQKTEGFRKIPTRIVGLEGKHAYNVNTTTAQLLNIGKFVWDVAV